MISASEKIRSAKGERSVAAILRACVDIMNEQGAAAMSQEAVARRAGITQSALRHHFPTKEALIEAVFRGAFATYRARWSEILLDPKPTPREKLQRLIDAHFEHIVSSSDAYAFEAFAHAARHPGARAERDDWYLWVADHYAALLRQIDPRLSGEAAEVRAYQVLTLVLGAWITLGRTRPHLLHDQTKAMTAALNLAIDHLVDGEA